MENTELKVDLATQAILDKLEQGTPLTEEEIQKVKYHESKQEQVALDRIIRGVNDVFVKDYVFEEFGGLALTIKIKAPNALEQGRINAVRENFVGGVGTMLNSFTYVSYHTLAVLEVCGIDVPKELNPKDIYNLGIVYKIGVDFAEWLSRFQY